MASRRSLQLSQVRLHAGPGSHSNAYRHLLVHFIKLYRVLALLFVFCPACRVQDFLTCTHIALVLSKFFLSLLLLLLTIVLIQESEAFYVFPESGDLENLEGQKGILISAEALKTTLDRRLTVNCSASFVTSSESVKIDWIPVLRIFGPKRNKK